MQASAGFIEKLALIAAIATEQGWAENAMEIFEGIKAERPDNVFALCGWAIAKINVAQFDEAIDVLRLQVLPHDPNNVIAECFLGKALLQNGQSLEGEKILGKFLYSDDGVCRAMAEECLQPV